MAGGGARRPRSRSQVHLVPGIRPGSSRTFLTPWGIEETKSRNPVNRSAATLWKVGRAGQGVRGNLRTNRQTAGRGRGPLGALQQATAAPHRISWRPGSREGPRDFEKSAALRDAAPVAQRSVEPSRGQCGLRSHGVTQRLGGSGLPGTSGEAGSRDGAEESSSAWAYLKP